SWSASPGAVMTTSLSRGRGGYHPPMRQRTASSRQRFRRYLDEHRSRGGTTGTKGGGEGAKPPPPRQRPFYALLLAFWGMLRGHRPTVVAALVTLTAAT